MNQYILIVEDDKDFQEELRSIIESNKNPSNIDTAQSMILAKKLISDKFYDLIILDLRILEDENKYSPSYTFGKNVFDHIKIVAPGTPVIILTGSSTEPIVEEISTTSTQLKIWSGEQRLSTVQVIKKHNLEKFESQLSLYCNSLSKILEVELDKQSQLEFEADRLIRIFSHRHGANLSSVSQLTDGNSSAVVYKVLLYNDDNLIFNTVAKISTRNRVAQESEVYPKYIQRLQRDCFPDRFPQIEFGAKNRAAVFYTLEQDSDSIFFDHINGAATDIAEKLKENLSPWFNDSKIRNVKVKEIRKLFISDDDLDAAFSILDFENEELLRSFESNTIRTRWSCQHMDLHGENILVTPDLQPIIIDFSDVQEGPASTDPISLEMSLLFHKNAPFRDSNWPISDDNVRWGEDRYISESPNPDFVKYCVDWANDASFANREIAAVLYSYLTRQAKYEDTDKNKIKYLLNSVCKIIRST